MVEFLFLLSGASFGDGVSYLLWEEVLVKAVLVEVLIK